MSFPALALALEAFPCVTQPSLDPTLKKRRCHVDVGRQDLLALRSSAGHLADAVTLRRALLRTLRSGAPLRSRGAEALGTRWTLALLHGAVALE